MTDQTPAPILCRVCGRPGGILALDGPCIDCTRARARAAVDNRCRCGKQRQTSNVHRVGSRSWTSCNRCLGTVAQLS